MLDNLVNIVYERYGVDHIDVYGGEIGLLPQNYLNEMFSILNFYKGYGTKVNVITNFLKINPALMENESIDISVSYDFDGRERDHEVFNNMINSTRDFSVLMLGTEKVLNQPVDRLISAFNFLKRLRSVEIKPYSTNQNNEHFISDSSFEEFIRKIASSEKRKFELVNETWAKDCIDGKYNAYSDNHLYITPKGNFAVLDFDDNDNEYFRIMESLDDYEEWADEEKKRVKSLSHCSKCQYLGGCMTEHYRHSCSGYPNLLDWFKTEAKQIS